MRDDIARSGSNVREADRSGRKEDLRHHRRDVHPGFVASRFGKESGGLLPFVLRAAQLFAISPEGGAKTLVYLASSPEVADLSGGYFFKCRASAPAPQAEDDNAAKRLWRESAKLADIE